MRRRLPGGFELDDDPARIDLDAVYLYLSTESYWAHGRPREEVERLIRAAGRVVGVYAGERQIGFARTYVDETGVAWLADVYVLEEFRGHGLGVELVRESLEHAPYGARRWMLRTADAHGLYEGFGFRRGEGRDMVREYHVPPVAAPNLQTTIAQLQAFWGERGCVLMQPYHTEVGAGTFNPATFLRCLGPRPWRTGYVEPVIRPVDGRYGENPYRFQQYLQYQVVLKPAPDDVLDLYFASLEAIGVDLSRHDLRLVEDDWEGPTLGAWGLGWEVWIDGLEVTQFTYFQQLGGLPVELVPAEITYGLERLALALQGRSTAFELEWAPGVTWGDVYRENERQWSVYNFEQAPVETLTRHFEDYERECAHLLELELPLAAYDHVLKCSHAFNVLDARGAISVSERAAYIGRVRNLARRVAQAYVEAEGKSHADAAA